MNDSTKLADAAVPFSWGVWFLSHIKDVNEILQAVALVAAIVASIAAAMYHLRKFKRLGRDK